MYVCMYATSSTGWLCINIAIQWTKDYRTFCMYMYICELNFQLKTNGVFFSTKKCALYFKKFNFVFVS